MISLTSLEAAYISSVIIYTVLLNYNLFTHAKKRIPLNKDFTLFAMVLSIVLAPLSLLGFIVFLVLGAFKKQKKKGEGLDDIDKLLQTMQGGGK